ncbi:MAG: hypothetical protein ABII18_08995 [bacterium]|nr:hypothetical protein [bacterium]MBU1918455.1 hypothetical protein [bacterium]
MNFTPVMGNASLVGMSPAMPLAYSPSFVTNEFSNFALGQRNCGPLAQYIEAPLAKAPLALDRQSSFFAQAAPQALPLQPDVSALQQPAQAAAAFTVPALATAEPFQPAAELFTDIASLAQPVAGESSLAVAALGGSLTQYLQERFNDIVNADKLALASNALLAAVIVLASFGVTWGAIEGLERIVERYVRRNDNIQPITKRRISSGFKLFQAIASSAITLFAGIAVSDSVESSIAGYGLSFIIATYFAREVYGIIKAYASISKAEELAEGKYVRIGQERGFVLYKGPTHTVLADFIPHAIVDKEIAEGKLTTPVDFQDEPTVILPLRLVELLAKGYPDYKIISNEVIAVATITPYPNQPRLTLDVINELLKHLDTDKQAPRKSDQFAVLEAKPKADAPVASETEAPGASDSTEPSTRRFILVLR